MLQKTVSAPAKINLILSIGAKRDDGYHDIDGVMARVSLCDVLHLSLDTASSAESLSMQCNNSTLSTKKDNLILRAARAFLGAAQIKNISLHIDLEKNIPIAAGLGGGSADAAAVLNTLNELFEYPLSEAALIGIGAHLGADVPFCLQNRPRRTCGIGEKLFPVAALPAAHVLVAMPDAALSTPEAFRLLDASRANETIVPHPFPVSLQPQNSPALSDLVNCLYNDFEPLVFRMVPASRHAHDCMLRNGAEGALLSGSGPAVFGLFSDTTSAKEAAGDLSEQGFSAYLCDLL